MILGAGLTAFYLLPAMTTQENVSMEVMRTGYSYYENGYFLPHLEGQLARNGFEYKLLSIVVTMIGLSTCLLVLVFRFSSQKRIKNECFFWFSIAVFSVFMMIPFSKPVYELFPPLKLIQFPWRFNVVLTLSAAGLLASGLSVAFRPFCAPKVAILVLASCLVILWFPQSYQPLMQGNLTQRPENGGFLTWRRQYNWCTPEYRPRWSRENPLTSVGRFGQTDGKPNKTRVMQGAATILVLEWNPRSIVLIADCRTNSLIEVAQFYYPGWTVESSSNAEIVSGPSIGSGLIAFAIPRGIQIVDIKLKKTTMERGSETISFVSLAVLLLVYLGHHRSWSFSTRGKRIFRSQIGN
jgi:hypothetical protein